MDFVDEQYQKLFEEMGPSYDLWRQYNREQDLYKQRYEDRLAERKTPKKGTYDGMKRAYINFRWAKFQEQESARHGGTVTARPAAPQPGPAIDSAVWTEPPSAACG